MRKIGIIGGLGPSATVDLYRWIIAKTPASKDQEHLRLIIDSHPQIPDRTQAFLENGLSPDAAFLESIALLRNSGVEAVACPCNTAHIFLRRLLSEQNFPFIDMIDATIERIAKGKARRVGLLSTSGTAKAALYQAAAEARGLECFTPSDIGIAKVMEAIYGPLGIKAGVEYEKSSHNKALLQEALSELHQNGAQAIILGCTELPLCLKSKDSMLPLINPTEELAAAIVRFALYVPTLL